MLIFFISIQFLLSSDPFRENLIGENLTIWVKVFFKTYVGIFFFTTLSFLYPNNLVYPNN